MSDARLGFDPGDWPAVSALLDRAMDVPPPSRREWLDALPPESARFRDTLMRLLAADGGVETNAMFAALPRMAVEAVAGDDGASALQPGQRVGPYVLLSAIGRGGMGSVWLAERVDALPRRKVALKLPHLGWAPGLAERVARERDILASLEHPNIARLYDAGVDAVGRPYLALEYVAGTPIDRYVADLALSVDARLRLLLQVAGAVAHAHAHLVVHRDLKPSNILVTESAEVRLLDFGIAKLLEESDAATEASELTRIAGRAMTPDYASPEQVRGDAVGTASDVYSLGIVAYEVLAGQRPYSLAKASTGKLADAIEAAEVPPASRIAIDPAVSRQLSGDIDAILNKALKKVPAERYATVAALADDVRRHLDDAPVLARPDTPVYRARKFVARNALAVGAGTAVLLAVLGGSAVSLWQARAARSEAARADQTKDFMLSIFRSAEAPRGAGAATTALDLLRQALRRVETELKDRPAVAVELMTAIGESMASQSELAEAAPLLKKAAELGRQRLGPDDRRTLEAEATLGAVLTESGHFDDAITLLSSTVPRARRVGANRALIEALGALGMSQVSKDQVEDAVANSQAAVDLVEAGAAGGDKVLAATTWLSHAGVLYYARRPGTTAAAQRAIDLEGEVAEGRLTGHAIEGREILGQGLAREGKLREALAIMEPLLDDASRFYGPLHRHVGMVENTLCMLRTEAGHGKAAAELCLEAAANTRRSGAATPFVEAIAYFNAGKAQVSGSDWPGALTSFERALALLKGAPDSSARVLQQVMAFRAGTLTRLGRLDEADAVLTSLATQRLDPLNLAVVQSQLAELRSRQGRHDEAIALARQALSVLDKAGNIRTRGSARNQLGSTLLAAGRPAEAAPLLREALEIYRTRELVASVQQNEVAEKLKRAEQLVAASASSPATRP